MKVVILYYKHGLHCQSHILHCSGATYISLTFPLKIVQGTFTNHSWELAEHFCGQQWEAIICTKEKHTIQIS